jgi:hypothetical protein
LSTPFSWSHHWQISKSRVESGKFKVKKYIHVEISEIGNDEFDKEKFYFPHLRIKAEIPQIYFHRMKLAVCPFTFEVEWSPQEYRKLARESLENDREIKVGWNIME